MKARVQVAVAVVFNSYGQVLWAKRPTGKPYANYWEFPGGKVEPNETVWQALVRELKEELDIVALEGGPWFIIDHDYEHANVRLHLYRVWRFSGTPRPLEQQTFEWGALDGQTLNPILPATEPLLPRLCLPQVMRITNFQNLPIKRALQLFENDKEKAGVHQLMIYFREKTLHNNSLVSAFQACSDWCAVTNVPMVLNSKSAEQLVQSGFKLPPNVALHLTQEHLFSLPAQLIEYKKLGASVHKVKHIEYAYEQGLFYALLGAVKATESHPGKVGIGWCGFNESVNELAKLPVYAVGGLGLSDMATAMKHGAHGIAMMRSAS